MTTDIVGKNVNNDRVCALCGSTDNLSTYDMVQKDYAGDVVSKITYTICDICHDNFNSHKNNYTLIRGHIMNKRWKSVWKVYLNNTLRHRDKGNNNIERIEDRFWKERLTMFVLRIAKPEDYLVRLFIEKWFGGDSEDSSISTFIMSECSKLFRDPDVWREEVKLNYSRKEREVILAEGV